MQRLVLLEAENRLFRKRNKELNKKRRTKKTRLRNGRSLSIEETQDLITDIAVHQVVVLQTGVL